MSCEPLKKLLRKRPIRPSFDVGFAGSSGFCCAEACVAKASAKTPVISTTRKSIAATNERKATKYSAFTKFTRNVTTLSREGRTGRSWLYRDGGFKFHACGGALA
jgi:hypothetical protein